MDQLRLFARILVVKVAVGCCTAQLGWASTPFTIETVDVGGSVGQFSSLARDAYGNPHISYFDAGSAALKYATKVRGAWQLETVDATAGVGQYTSIALDRFGDPWISYYDYANGDLKLAHRSANWLIEVVDSTGDVGRYSSMALDAAGDPHVAYWDFTSTRLKYACHDGGAWSVEFVTPSGFGRHCSLKLDADARPHLSYVAESGQLQYAVKLAGSWITESVSNLSWPTVRSPTALALDTRGMPHISYQSGGGWVATTRRSRQSGNRWVDGRTGGGGTHSSIAVDPLDEEHFAYYDAVTRALGYVSYDNAASPLVDISGDVGQYPSLALDSEGNPAISYYDATQRALKYADASVDLLVPAGGEVWPVGSVREIVWSGVGPVSILLSPDGGNRYEVLQENVTTTPWALRVPLVPTRFARIKIERQRPENVASWYPSTAISDSFFTIEASVELLSFRAGSTSEGVELSWSTRPGPEDLGGYRVERAHGPGWDLIASLTRGTRLIDPLGGPGTRYRLSAVNGLGMSLLLGEVLPTPDRALAAWPIPYRGGALRISFATASGLGGGPGEAKVEIYDVAGRRVRTLLDATYAAGYHEVIWDGRDEGGIDVPNGLYVIRATGSGNARSLKLVRTR